MKFLGQLNNDVVTLEVYECDCGYHAGFDSSYLEQVGDIKFLCPSCGDTTTIEGDDSDQ